MKKMVFLLFMFAVTSLCRVEKSAHILGGKFWYVLAYDPRGYIYTIKGNRLFVLDVTNPDDPEVRPTRVYFDSNGERVDYGCVCEKMLIVSSYSKLYAVDLTNPLDPKMLFEEDLPMNMKTIACVGDGIVYISGLYENGTHIYRISNSGFVRLGYFDQAIGSTNEIVGNLLISGSGLDWGNIKIFDVSDKTHPKYLARINDVEGCYGFDKYYCYKGFTVKGDHLYTLDQRNYYAFDISDPERPRLVWKRSASEFVKPQNICSSDKSSFATGIATLKDNLLVGLAIGPRECDGYSKRYTYLVLFDIEDPSRPKFMGSYRGVSIDEADLNYVFSDGLRNVLTLDTEKWIVCNYRVYKPKMVAKRGTREEHRNTVVDIEYLHGTGSECIISPEISISFDNTVIRLPLGGRITLIFKDIRGYKELKINPAKVGFFSQVYLTSIPIKPGLWKIRVYECSDGVHVFYERTP